MFVAAEKNGKTQVIPTKEAVLFSETETKILAALAKKPAYPKELAQRLGMHEQNLYYHIRSLEKRSLIKVVKKEERGAALAKYYALSKPSFFVRFADFQPSAKLPRTSAWLEPFIIEGRLNARIVAGSPDPHGPERARSRDAYYAIDLGLFLGSFLIESNPSVTLDTDIRSMKSNMIVIGGPVINRITRMINNKLPIRFDKKRNIYSSLTKKTYRSDDCGLIVKIKNPHNEKSKIIVIAGKRYSGTRAAILTFLQNFEEISKKDSHVVQGIDQDSDGIIDTVKILE